MVLLAGFVLAHGVALGYLCHQATVTTRPGDRLIVVFPHEMPASDALERLGRAGGTLVAATGWPGVFAIDAVDAEVADRLASQAWVMRVPGEPTFAGCVAFVLNRRVAGS